MQLAQSKDKLEMNVLHLLVVIKHVTVPGLESVLQFVVLMDANVPLEQS